MPTHQKVDVVAIGAGWTASALAWKLTAAGLRVVSLEQGPSRWANPEFEHDHDPLRYETRLAMMVDKRKETWTWRPDTRSPSLPIRQYGAFYPGMGLGGSGVHWSGQLFRFTPFDFQLRTSYTQKYGQGILPPGSSIQDWPITYEELEPYYDAYEYDIGASGQVGNLGGQLIPGGNPFEAPRSRPYPLPPLPVTIPSNLFADACREVGYHPFPQPAAIASQAFRDPFGNYRSGCILCGFCTRYGCEVDAKSSPQTTYIPVALATGHYEIRYDAHVVRVNVGADGLATGVTYIDAQGQEHEQPADIVLLTGFTLSNVKLLLVSRGGRHSNGIGNDRGQVGRNCTHQYWTAPVAGVFKDRRFNLYMGNTCTQNTIYDLYESVIDHSGLGFIGGGGVYSTLGERTPIMSASAYPVAGGGKKWGRDWKEALRTTWDGTVDFFMQGSSPAYDFHFYDLDPTYRDAWGMPLLRYTLDWQPNEQKMHDYMARQLRPVMERMGPTAMTVQDAKPYRQTHFYGTHNTGGAIMGRDPSDSVTNNYGQVWDTPNVFVTGATLFPQNPGANPTDTICALALRTGDAIRDKYLKNPERLIG